MTTGEWHEAKHKEDDAQDKTSLLLLLLYSTLNKQSSMRFKCICMWQEVKCKWGWHWCFFKRNRHPIFNVILLWYPMKYEDREQKSSLPSSKSSPASSDHFTLCWWVSFPYFYLSIISDLKPACERLCCRIWCEMKRYRKSMRGLSRTEGEKKERLSGKGIEGNDRHLIAFCRVSCLTLVASRLIVSFASLQTFSLYQKLMLLHSFCCLMC